MPIDMYEHLAAYGFDTVEQVPQRLAHLPESDLTQFLMMYRKQAEERVLAFQADAGNIDIYPDSWDEGFPLEAVKQLAIYAHRIYLHDPLLKLVPNWQDLDFDFTELVRRSSREERVAGYYSEVMQAIQQLLLLRPLVEAGIVHFTPTALIQPRRSPRDMYLDNFYGSEGSGEKLAGLEQPLELPPAFRSYIHEHFKVMPARYVDRKPVLMPDTPLTPRRMIALGFRGDHSPHIQLLGDVQTVDEEPGRLLMHYPLQETDGNEPEEAMFWQWVEGTKQQVIRERLQRLTQDIALARAARARFLTSLPASRDFAQLSTGSTPPAHHDGISSFLKMHLPYFDEANFASIAQARRNEVAFEDFRSALRKALKEVEHCSSPQEVQERLEDIHHDLLRQPLAKIDQRMKGLQRSFVPKTLIAAGTLTTGFFFSGQMLLAGSSLAGLFVGTATEAYQWRRDRKKEQGDMQELPSYFYWEATHPQRQKPGSRLLARTGKHIA